MKRISAMFIAAAMAVLSACSGVNDTVVTTEPPAVTAEPTEEPIAPTAEPVAPTAEPVVAAAEPTAEPTAEQPAAATFFDGYISRVPPAFDFKSFWGDEYVTATIPRYTNSGNSFQSDLRSRDVSGADMTSNPDTLNDLLHSDFDSDTVWGENLPEGFDPAAIMELGKDPGLGVRSLHERGITGKGVSIGIIDQTLLTSHAEYADRLVYYDEFGDVDFNAAMHGAAVASLAVGKSVGVAPEAELYFIAANNIMNSDGNGHFDLTYKYVAEGIHRFLDINKQLPDEKKIRVISISWGANGSFDGYKDMSAALSRAEDEGVLVVTASLGENDGYDFDYMGAAREPMSDPNAPSSYSVGIFGKKDMKYEQVYKRVFFPMDSRTYASFTGDGDYTWGAVGGISWVCPYIAGLYALACQVKPDITPTAFLDAVKSTAYKSSVTVPGPDDHAPFHIVNPVKLIGELTPTEQTEVKAPVKLPYIARVPAALDYAALAEWRGEPVVLTEIPAYDASKVSFEVDLRSRDVSGADLTSNPDVLKRLLRSNFDSNTVWGENLPDGFDPYKIMELGKDPGLGVRGLHDKGITGKGVSVGIVDQTLLVDHVEYADNLVLYEELNDNGYEAQMHGPAVASIAVGKTVGVAPDAKLFYINCDWNWKEYSSEGYKYYAMGLNRLLDINETLPDNEKIRVISISKGFERGGRDYKMYKDALDRAKKDGVFVVDTTLDTSYGFRLAGTGRDPMGGADDLSAYSVGIFQRSQARGMTRNVFFPMDSRTFASPSGTSDYAWGASGGWSWVSPYIAGLYALACQADPSITPELFLKTADSTATKQTVVNNAAKITIKIANPAELIGAIAPTKQTSAAAERHIARVPAPSDFWEGYVTEIPRYRGFTASFEIDLRSRDVSGADLTSDPKTVDALLHSDFDSNTVWSEKLPDGFDPDVIMELGKNPGLGVRGLHERGITGKGVSVGIIDQTLLVNHVEYADNLVYYEELGDVPNTAQMHAPAVASIAVGKSVGVAPGADLYFIAAQNIVGRDAKGNFETTYKYYAEGINKLLDLNKTLPAAKRIRVISISWGVMSSVDGYREMSAALKRAKNEDVLVITVSIDDNDDGYGFPFSGTGRDPMRSADDLAAYSMGEFERSSSFDFFKNRIFFPMDSRTYASCTGESNYEWCAVGGMSWVCPYMAGLYALCCQVYPDLMPELFLKAVRTTATKQAIDGYGKDAKINIVNPVKVVEKFNK